MYTPPLVLGVALLLGLTPTALASSDCYGGHVGDPAHTAEMDKENFGTDWALTIALPALQDLLTDGLRTDTVRPYLEWSGSFKVLSVLDIDYRYRPTGLSLSADDDRLAVTLPIDGYARIGSTTCTGTGEMVVEFDPALVTDAGSLWFETTDVDVDLSKMPVLCGLSPTSTWFSTVASVLEYQLELLLERRWFSVQDLAGIDAAELSSVTTDLGIADPFDDVQLVVVDADNPYVLIGGDLVKTASCASSDYPLFDPDALQTFDGSLGDHGITLAISMRTVPILEELFEGEITDVVDEGLAGLMEDAGLGWLSAKLDDLTLKYNGLKSNKSPCDCTTGDTEYWFNLSETDPELSFKLFFKVRAKAFSILGWDPGPITEQLDGHASFAVTAPKDGSAPGLGAEVNFNRANVYGPWWADTLAWVLENFCSLDIQDAALFNDILGDDLIPITWIKPQLSTGTGTVSACATQSWYASQAIDFVYQTGDYDASNWDDACGGADSDRDGSSDTTEAAEGTDATNPDSDEDGLTDGYERIVGCDPSEADSDGDGVSDWNELIRIGTECMDPDTDGDGASDGCEDDLGTVDPLDEDSDGDGKLDGDEDIVTLGCP